MLDNLTQRLAKVVKTIRGEARLTETNTAEMLREVRLALLEADVALPVVKSFIGKVREKAVGKEVMDSLSPGQALVGVVQQELSQIMGADLGEKASQLNFATQPPAIILMAGLQGVGKTTTVGKLARYLKQEKKKKVLTVSTDVYRPAAIKQLQVVGKNYNIPVFEMGTEVSPVEISKKALEYAAQQHHDVILIDTAGRLHINEELMQELQDIKTAVRPQEILLVVDAMTGQDAVTVAESFDGQLGVDGIILTKLDGDARGGAALSVRSVTNKPIKYIGMGEKMEDLEPFYPDRMASRILGMGDVLTLIEKAESTVNEKDARKLAQKLEENKFDMNDLLDQLRQIQKMGSLKSIIGMLPGVGDKMKDVDLDDRQFVRIEAMITSMTKAERAKPSIINPSRKRRIAAGSGTKVEEINRLLKQFEQMQKMMKQFGSKGGKLGRRARKQLAGMNLEQLQNSIQGNIPGVPPGLMPKK